MKKLLKNYLLKSKHTYIKNRYKHFIMLVVVAFSLSAKSQIANYVNNPSFESIVPNPGFPNYNTAKFWGPLDTNKYCYYIYSTSPSFSVPLAPYISTGFQYPRTGKNLILTSFYCDLSTCTYTWSRGYPRNRLKQTLKANTEYCAKYYIVNTNNCTVGIDAYGAYFGDNDLDTIKYCVTPLVYLNPQISNTTANVIKDTLNWIPITGTFVANGTEKYMVLGNYKSNVSTTTLILNPANLPNLGNDIYIDDVSLIEKDLPADAGIDKALIPGDSVFIGRQPDVGIDEACFWYKLPSTITPTTPAIDTVAGLWVKPISTSTYVVRQQIWCGTVKYDTVVIYMNPVGIEKLKILSEELKIYPIPAKDYFELRISTSRSSAKDEWMKEFNTLLIYNNLGLLLREEELRFKDGSVKIEVGDLPNGAYSIQLKSSSNEIINKRFMIER